MDYYRKHTGTDGEVVVTTDTNLPLPSEIRNAWCFGLPLSKDNGEVMTDEEILLWLESAVVEAERRLGVFLLPKKVVSNPGERGLIEGEDYDVAEPAYDYSVRDYRNYGFLQLRQRQVKSIETFRLVLPNGNVIVDFTSSKTMRQWIKLYPKAGQIHLVPYAGDPTLFALLGGTQSGYPFVTGSINSNLPQMFHVDYTAGFGLHQIPADIRNIVAKMAAIEVLGFAGDAVLAGIASISTGIDGLSESTSLTASATSATYGAHISQLKKEVEQFFSPKGAGARSSVRGITMVGL